MSTPACPSELELHRGLTLGADDALRAHLASCAICRGEWERFEVAIEHARELPVELPDVARREQARTALLAASDREVRRPRRSRWTLPAAGAAAAAALIGYAVVRTTAPAEPEVIGARGVVHPHPGAVYVSSGLPDEVVVLRDGTIDVHVEPLGPGRRFRVIVGDDEVEVRGTAFEVIAAAGRLRAVQVVHGRVEVRRVGQPTMLLRAGQQWHAPVVTARVEDAPVQVPVPVPVPVPPPTSMHRRPARTAPPITALPPTPVPTEQPGPDELAFVAGWNAMRSNNFEDAAHQFAAVIAQAPHGKLAVDARYWLAVAAARGAQPRSAIAPFREFLAQYPEDARAGEASAMLGWLLLESGDRTEAKQRFEAAARDARDTVRESARAGLDELAR